MKISIGAAIAAAVLLSPGLATAQVVWETGLGVEHSSGAYGSTVSDTEATSVPLTLRAKTEDWRIDLTVPYVRLKGPGSVISGGVVIPGGPVTSQSGLGDVVLSGAFLLPRTDGPFIELGGAVKFATADTGIGTDEMDYAVNLAFRQPVGERVSLTGGLGYQWLGDPPLIDLKDGFAASLGFNSQGGPRTIWGGSVNYRQAYLAGQDEPLSVSSFLRFNGEEGWSFIGFAAAGLSDASPDYAVGVQLLKAY